jgi:hypothetical protein
VRVRQQNNTGYLEAAAHGHLSVIQWFGKDKTSKYLDDNDSLLQANEVWSFEIVWGCCAGYIFVFHTFTGHVLCALQRRNTALHLACQNGHVAVAEWLHKNIVDLRDKTNDVCASDVAVVRVCVFE